MQTYVSHTAGGAIREIAFEGQGAARRCFVVLADASASARVAACLASGHQLLGTHPTAHGAVMVFRSTVAPTETLAALASDGQQFAPLVAKKSFNPWALRGISSIIGQSGQLLSGYLVYDHAKKIRASNLEHVKADSAAIIGFATLNLMANAINILFGAQKKTDPYHLAFLKNQLNARMQAEYGLALPSEDHEAGSALGQKRSFLERNSVAFGEVFLRTLGSVSLVFPVTQLKTAFGQWRANGWKAGLMAAKSHDKITFFYGLAMLTGKFSSFLAREPDPYNPEPPSTWRNFREKVAFKLSSVIEGLGAGFATVDRYHRKRIYIGGKELRDIPGSLGNLVFVGGYGIRYTAPYGTREVAMPEFYAHAARTIARLPENRQEQALGDIAVWIADHFADKAEEAYRLPKVYAALQAALAASAVKDVPASSPQVAVNAALPSTRIAQVDHENTVTLPRTAMIAG